MKLVKYSGSSVFVDFDEFDVQPKECFAEHETSFDLTTHITDPLRKISVKKEHCIIDSSRDKSLLRTLGNMVSNKKWKGIQVIAEEVVKKDSYLLREIFDRFKKSENKCIRDLAYRRVKFFNHLQENCFDNSVKKKIKNTIT